MLKCFNHTFLSLSPLCARIRHNSGIKNVILMTVPTHSHMLILHPIKALLIYMMLTWMYKKKEGFLGTRPHGLL